MASSKKMSVSKAHDIQLIATSKSQSPRQKNNFARERAFVAVKAQSTLEEWRPFKEMDFLRMQ